MVKNFESLGWRLRENFQKISEKIWCYFSSILDKISDNLIKYCVYNVYNEKKFACRRNYARNLMLEKSCRFEEIQSRGPVTTFVVGCISNEPTFSSNLLVSRTLEPRLFDFELSDFAIILANYCNQFLLAIRA